MHISQLEYFLSWRRTPLLIWKDRFYSQVGSEVYQLSVQYITKLYIIPMFIISWRSYFGKSKHESPAKGNPHRRAFHRAPVSRSMDWSNMAGSISWFRMLSAQWKKGKTQMASNRSKLLDSGDQNSSIMINRYLRFPEQILCPLHPQMTSQVVRSPFHIHSLISS